MEYRHLELASHLFDSCLFDEALGVLESGLLRTPVDLPTAKETAILMTLAAYPLSHLGAETVKTIAYNSVHRGARDGQKTPGARATALLRRFLDFSKGDKPANERMKIVLRSSLIDHIKEVPKTTIATTREKEMRTRAADESDWDTAGQVPVDRLKQEGVDSSLLRDVVPEHEQLKRHSDHLKPLLYYTNTSLWISLWSVYGYYLACSGSPNTAHLSAWVTVKPLLDVIQSIVAADPVILATFYDNQNSMTEICNRILPGKGRPFAPLFVGDVDFGPNFDPETVQQLREAAFAESMQIRETWVNLLRENLHLIGTPASKESYLLDRFSTFAATHHQVIPRVYPCEHLPEYYTIFMFQKYIRFCTQRGKGVVNASNFLELVEQGKEKKILKDALTLISEALGGNPDRGMTEGGPREYSQVLYAFYGHAQLWVKLALESDSTSHKRLLEMLNDGRQERYNILRSYGSKDAKVEALCKQEEDALVAIVQANKILREYMEDGSTGDSDDSMGDSMDEDF
ncbi:hypothetical protein CJU90_4592 [Yarrowia sp. C11]|nr:hypothetical protein CJU90_4592 [Yarrowia sp. C11]KAG5370534.1 hypothetical protein CKK34_0641 [Yarrowia sp. E02]